MFKSLLILVASLMFTNHEQSLYVTIMRLSPLTKEALRYSFHVLFINFYHFISCIKIGFQLL